MRQQVILNIKGYPVKVMVNYVSRISNTYHYAYGMIFVRINNHYSLKRLENDLNERFKEEIIAKFNNDPLIEGNYAYILGEIERIYPKEDNNLIDNVYVLYQGKKMLAKKYLLIIITERVRYYEKIMNLGFHDIKIKQMCSVFGINKYRKKELVFNENLIHFSIDLIDQVVIHELCHDFYQNHSKNFYNKMKEYCPDYKIKKEKLTFGVRK